MNSGPTLQIGSTGPDVRRLQILFVMTKLLDYTGIDGSFGPQTQDAVQIVPAIKQSHGGWGGRTSNVERASSGSEHAEVSPQVNGQCCIRTAKSAGNISTVQTLQPILGLSMGTLARGLNRPCAPIKRSKTL